MEDAIAKGVVHLHEGDSADLMAGFPNQYFDWIYVDADHSLVGVRRDISASANKVKPGGHLIFNDYTCWSPVENIPYGVLHAVNEFVVAERWSIAFVALHGLGYHDIALRCPALAT